MPKKRHRRSGEDLHMTPIKWFYGFLKKYQKLMIGGLFLTTVM